MKEVKITSDYITLGQFLKLTDFASSGGEVKYLLSSLEIYVNQELENRRGKKLYHNDVVKIDENCFKITYVNQ